MADKFSSICALLISATFDSGDSVHGPEQNNKTSHLEKRAIPPCPRASYESKWRVQLKFFFKVFSDREGDAQYPPRPPPAPPSPPHPAPGLSRVFPPSPHAFR